MIDINELFKKYSNHTSLNEGHYDYMLDKQDFKDALKEYTELLLQKLVDNIGFVETTSEKLNNEEYKPFITDEDGKIWTIDKKLITSIINDINFD